VLDREVEALMGGEDVCLCMLLLRYEVTRKENMYLDL
jgi:hypothetical protein